MQSRITMLLVVVCVALWAQTGRVEAQGVVVANAPIDPPTHSFLVGAQAPTTTVAEQEFHPVAVVPEREQAPLQGQKPGVDRQAYMSDVDSATAKSEAKWRMELRASLDARKKGNLQSARRHSAKAGGISRQFLALDKRVSGLETNLGSLRSEVDDLGSRVNENKSEITVLGGRVKGLEKAGFLTRAEAEEKFAPRNRFPWWAWFWAVVVTGVGVAVLYLHAPAWRRTEPDDSVSSDAGEE